MHKKVNKAICWMFILPHAMMTINHFNVDSANVAENTKVFMMNP